MIKKSNIILFELIVFSLLMMFVVSASDDELLIPCGGDEESIILCVGDLENSPIGKNIYTAPNITGRTGGIISSTRSIFDAEFICNLTRDFLTEKETTRQELLFKINNESTIFISQSVLDQYINNFEERCNITIEEKREVEEKIIFPFLFILLIASLIHSYYHREKIKKWILVLFDDNKDDDDLTDEDPDLIEYIKSD